MTTPLSELITAARLADNIALEMFVAADVLASKGKTKCVRLLLGEVRRHNAEAIRLRSQVVAVQLTQGASLRRENPGQ